MSCRACTELIALGGHNRDSSIDAAQSLAANKLADFLDPDSVAFVPLIQQLIIAEDCL